MLQLGAFLLGSFSISEALHVLPCPGVHHRQRLAQRLLCRPGRCLRPRHSALRRGLVAGAALRTAGDDAGNLRRKMGERAPESLRPSGNVASDGGRSCWMHEGIPDVSEQISTGLVLVRFPPQQSPVRSGGFEYCYGASRPCCHLGPGFSTSEISQTLDSFNGIDPYAPVADCRCVPYLSARTHFEASGFRLCLPIGQLVQRALFLKQRLFNATQLAGFEPTSQLLPMRRFIFRTVPATSGRIGGVGIRCSQCS
mmetsp:Transcript_7583/g.15770  ORF Transcript_7583/g.15770 Transcript_7583/m.15770 type:complete len:254 (-) Transcript_7583:174-935(-)